MQAGGPLVVVCLVGSTAQILQRRHDGLLVHRMRSLSLHLASGLHDGAVSGAAAQVARQRLVGGVRVYALALRGAALVQCKQAHDKAGRAKAALRTMALDHGLLHRVQRAVGPGQVGGGPQRHTVDGLGRLDTAVDSAVLQTAIDGLSHHHSAGPAVACGAAFFGGRQAQVLPQQVQQGAVWWDVMAFNHRIAVPKAQRRFSMREMSGVHGQCP